MKSLNTTSSTALSGMRAFTHNPACRTAVLFASLLSLTLGAVERLDRGVVVLPRGESQVYIGWRLLASDPSDIAFDVFRCVGRERQKLNLEPISNSCHFVDQFRSAGQAVSYVVSPLSRKQKPSGSSLATLQPQPSAASSQPDFGGCVRLKLQGDYLCNKVAFADLDGDGKLDYVVKQPQQITDPGVWQRSTNTFKVEAYRSDGTFMWRKDLGWNIEQGIWYSPMVVYDFNGDGKAEVALKTAPTDKDYRNAAGRVLDGPEFCSILDGETGNEITRVDWIPRGQVSDWGDATGNRASRHMLGVAYLDGKTPSLIVHRGTYTTMRVEVYNLVGKTLRHVWSWNGDNEKPPVRGQGLHGMQAADIDGDSRDELVLGSVALDDNGKVLWCTGLGHPDACYVTDIDPARPGFEIMYGIEHAQQSNGICLVEARTGKIIWGCNHPTTHVHSQGLLADIDPDNPGMEFYCGEKFLDDRWLYSTLTGKLLSREDLGSLAPNPVYWMDGPFKAYVARERILKYKGPQVGAIEGKVIAIGDVVGDWREEVITTMPGEIRIYSTTIPTTSRRVCFLQDRLYRTGLAMETSGYLYPPQTGGSVLGNLEQRSFWSRLGL